MQEYGDREALITEIEKTARLFIAEFREVSGENADLRLEGVDRTPREMLAYQLGWMELLRGWDRRELAGETVVTPAPGYRWNQMGELYEEFYSRYAACSLQELETAFTAAVEGITAWIRTFDEDALFLPGGREWARSTPANWPVWKWIHINTVAPFKSFRSKIRKWKKLNAA